MRDLFVEAIMFRSGEMADRILDQSVSSLNGLNRIKHRLNGLGWEMDLRGENLHGFSRSQLEVPGQLLRDLRLACFQLESGAVNYRRLVEAGDRTGSPIPETDYARFSVKARELARHLDRLQESVTREDPAPLAHGPPPEESEGLDYSHLFEELGSGDVRVLAVDTMAAIHQIESLLRRLSVHLRDCYRIRSEERGDSPGTAGGRGP